VEDIKRAEYLGYKIPPKFLEELRKASGRKIEEKVNQAAAKTDMGNRSSSFGRPVELTFWGDRGMPLKLNSSGGLRCKCSCTEGSSLLSPKRLRAGSRSLSDQFTHVRMVKFSATSGKRTVSKLSKSKQAKNGLAFFSVFQGYQLLLFMTRRGSFCVCLESSIYE